MVNETERTHYLGMKYVEKALKILPFVLGNHSQLKSFIFDAIYYYLEIVPDISFLLVDKNGKLRLKRLYLTFYVAKERVLRHKDHLWLASYLYKALRRNELSLLIGFLIGFLIF